MKGIVKSVLVVWLGGYCLGQQAATRRPNIIFIYTDDQASWSLRVSGNRDALTPNMDRLVEQGAYFVNHFTPTPVCSPSRASMMVSRYGTEVGITDYINPGRQPDLGLDPKYVTWAEVLSQGGYQTGFFGKWHLGSRDRYHPTRQGFQEFAGFRTGGRISKDPEVEVQGKKRRISGYTPDILTDFAIDFIKRHRSGPFLVSLHFWAPHANTDNRTPDGDRTWLPLSEADWKPFQTLDPILPEPDYPNLDVPRVKRMMREYLASIASVDRNLGRLMTFLDESGLTANTIVIFSSDHGYNMGHHGIWHKGNGRWIVKGFGPHPVASDVDYHHFQEYRPNLFDNSLRVPTAVRWPGVVSAGLVIEQTTSNLDWYPTLVAMAELTLPPGVKIRGRNLMPLLLKDSVSWEEDFYAQYSMAHGVMADLRCYRTVNWKLIRDFRTSGHDELFNLKRDPAEMSNLIQSQDPWIQEIRRRLNAKLLAKMKEISDPILPDSRK